MNYQETEGAREGVTRSWLRALDAGAARKCSDSARTVSSACVELRLSPKSRVNAAGGVGRRVVGAVGAGTLPLILGQVN